MNIERVGKFDVGGVARTHNMTSLIVKSYIMYLEATFHAVRQASRETGRYIRCRFITDASGRGLNHLRHAGIMRVVTSVGQQNFPELIHTVSVVNAPGIFTTVWGAAKHLLAERIQKKVSVLGTTFLDDLSLMGIPPACLPAFLGGQAAHLDADLAQAERFPNQPLEVPGPPPRLEALRNLAG